MAALLCCFRWSLCLPAWELGCKCSAAVRGMAEHLLAARQPPQGDIKLYCSCSMLQVDAKAATGAASTAQPSPTNAASVAAVEALPAVAPPLSGQAPTTQPTSSPPAGADDDPGLVSN